MAAADRPGKVPESAGAAGAITERPAPDQAASSVPDGEGGEAGALR
jgi:hypothetical protein